MGRVSEYGSDFTFRESLLIAVGAAVAQLLIMTGDRFYGREYRAGVLFLATAAGLAFIFFRRRRIVLVFSALSYILVIAGLTAPFHPSVLAYSLTIGSGAALYLIARWTTRRYPYLKRRDRHILFQGEAAMDAENKNRQTLTNSRSSATAKAPLLR